MRPKNYIRNLFLLGQQEYNGQEPDTHKESPLMNRNSLGVIFTWFESFVNPQKKKSVK